MHKRKKICDDLWGWGLLPLDFGSRIRSVEMNILPWLLYLFLSLPVEVPENQFREWNKHISRFIWYKRPRVKFPTLQLSEGEGGMAPPSLKDYYTSAQLKPLVYWCNPSYVAKWKTVGLFLTDIPIQSLLGCVGKEKEQTASRWVNFSLKIWVEVVKCFQLQKEVKLLNWPAYDSEFTPALLDHSGITAMCNIVNKGELDSFNNLCQIYGLGGQDLYRYLQLQWLF